VVVVKGGHLLRRKHWAVDEHVGHASLHPALVTDYHLVSEAAPERSSGQPALHLFSRALVVSGARENRCEVLQRRSEAMESSVSIRVVVRALVEVYLGWPDSVSAEVRLIDHLLLPEAPLRTAG